MTRALERRDDFLAPHVSSIPEILDELRNGRMIVLVDAEDRENEGDLVIPAQLATPNAINFMARFGRGLICLALTARRTRDLQLPLMTGANRAANRTAFTVSIEAREGVSTGISAYDRARTIATAIDAANGADDIRTPGHVFPLVAQDGGVLMRAGHTEAAVDLARMAGLNASGVICEIMSDDGAMARAPELVAFAKQHGLKIATIADLIAFRAEHDQPVVRRRIEDFPTAFGSGFKAVIYEDTIGDVEHFALCKGEPAKHDEVVTRIHAVNIARDLLGYRGGHHDMLANALREIDAEGTGVLVVIRDVRPQFALPDLLYSYFDETDARIRFAGNEFRQYGLGAQILRDLGVRNMILLTNSPDRKLVGLEGFGLRIVGTRQIPVTASERKPAASTGSGQA